MRQFFESVLRRCISEELVGGEGFAIDASVSARVPRWTRGNQPHRRRRRCRSTRDAPNYLIDLEAGIIVDVEATPAHGTMEVESTKTMIERVEQRLALKPDRLVGDTACGTAPMLAWMVKDKGNAPHEPVWDRSDRKDGTLTALDAR